MGLIFYCNGERLDPTEEHGIIWVIQWVAAGPLIKKSDYLIREENLHVATIL